MFLITLSTNILRGMVLVCPLCLGTTGIFRRRRVSTEHLPLQLTSSRVGPMSFCFIHSIACPATHIFPPPPFSLLSSIPETHPVIIVFFLLLCSILQQTTHMHAIEQAGERFAVLKIDIKSAFPRSHRKKCSLITALHSHDQLAKYYPVPWLR